MFEKIYSFILNLKINKLILSIAHLFGFRKEHIDNITINIDKDEYDLESINIFLYDSPFLKIKDLNNRYDWSRSENDIQSLIKDIKQKVYKELSDNPKLEKRCANVKQVYLTFYYKGDKVRKGSILKTLLYQNKTLYYPYDPREKKMFDRDCTIDNILS